MDRRSFLRVALLGGAGAVAVVACPEFIADMLAPKKSYFFMGGIPVSQSALCKLVYRKSPLFVAVKARQIGMTSFTKAMFDVTIQKIEYMRSQLPAMKLDQAFLNAILL